MQSVHICILSLHKHTVKVSIPSVHSDAFNTYQYTIRTHAAVHARVLSVNKQCTDAGHTHIHDISCREKLCVLTFPELDGSADLQLIRNYSNPKALSKQR